MKFFLVIIFIVAVAFGIVAFQNNTEITVKFINWVFTDHIAIVLGVPFCAGLAAGISLLLPSLWKKASQARHFKKRIQELEEEQAQGPGEEAEEPAEAEAKDETPVEEEEPRKP